MKMVTTRLLMFSIGLPSVIALVIVFPHQQHIIMNLAVIIVSSLGAMELSRILRKDISVLGQIEASILGSALPLGVTLTQYIPGGYPFEIITVTLSVVWTTASQIFTPQNRLDNIRDRIFTSLSAILYPGSLMLWIILMTRLKFATEVIITYLLCVFANDSVAWLIGMLFGKRNRGIVSISPNKSLAGFIGGMVGSTAIGILAPLIYPQAFVSTGISAILAGAILAFGSGIAAIIGDLAESALKRSSNTKDSGTIIPGRGGMLDSIDSLSFAAPVFLGLFYLLFTV